MKKSIVVLLIVLLVLTAAGIFLFYRYWYQEDALEAWELVPESAVMVYETEQLVPTWQEVSQSSLWQNLSAIPAYDSLSYYFQELDSVQPLEDFFRKKQVLIGIHVVARDDFDFSYFFNVRGPQDKGALQQFLDQYGKKSHIRTESRTYSGFTIHELTDTQTNKRFSYILYKNIFAGSFTPFLIEDIIRNIDTKFSENSFATVNPALKQLPKLTDDEGNLYLNCQKIPLLLSVFTGKDRQQHLEPLAYLAQAMFLDVDVSENQLLLNGFSTLPSSEEKPAATFLSTFDEQSAGSIDMQAYIPDRTAVFTHMTFSDPLAWQQKLFAYQQHYDDPVLKESLAYRQQLQQYKKIDLSSFFRWFQKEAGLLVLESVEVETPDQVLILGVKDTARIKQACLQVNDALRSENSEVPYEEKFSGYEIHEIRQQEFPAALLGPLALGFDKCFYLLTEDYWIMANNVRALKRLILDREAENTWNKSILFNRFLETTVDQANLSYIVNTARAWALFMHSLSPEWQQFMQQYADQFKALEHLAIQFSKSEQEFYTSLAVDYAAEPNVRKSRQFQTVQQVFYDNQVKTQPFVVRNHENQAWEVVLQDDSNFFYLASTGGEILWKDSLPGKIVGGVQQIDFYNNGKLQYLFATEHAIHILDRNGDEVEGYPMYLPEEVTVQYLSLIDYDNSKKYRFLITDTSGKLWMFNKDRENLEGWNPRVLEGTLASAPIHIRVRDRDFILAVQQDGTILLMNRKGQLYGGFPISLNTSIQSTAFVTQNSGLGNSTITTITAQGEVVAFNLLGNIVKREQLYRPSAESRFSICIDALGKTYVIVRQDEDKLGILDRKGVLLFEKSYISPLALTSDMLEVQYYDFGAGHDVFAITDKIQEFTYLFNGSGNLVKDRPIESKYGVGILYFEDEEVYRVYRSYAKEHAIISFSI